MPTQDGNESSQRWYPVERDWGARWIRCALQVNPFQYVARHKRPPDIDESTYNSELVDALLAADVGIIAITDHYRVKESVSLASAARAAGVIALLGFEASTSEGVHMLCIFDEACDVDTIDRRIGALGVEPNTGDSPIGTLSVVDLLAKCDEWDAACIAAHVTYDSGLLKQLSGLARIKAWTSPHLVAAAIAGQPDALPEPYASILANRDGEYHRDRPVAILNASDVNGAADVTRPGTSCRLKLSERSLAAIRQAFLDPESRVRLDSDSDDSARPTVRAIHWEGGFLAGQTVQFADELSVLVGAPGAGKSTIIESLRAAFDLAPSSPRAREDHRAILDQVLGSQTTISVVVHYPLPAPTTYVIERTLPNPPVVLSGDTLQPCGLSVGDLQPTLQVYGQHEVAELAEDAERRTALLERFVKRRPERDAARQALRDEIKNLRGTIVKQSAHCDQLESRLSLLPGQEEKLKRYDDAGVATKLAMQTQFDRELRVIDAAREEIQSLSDALKGFADRLPLQTVARGNQQVATSPFLDQLTRLDATLRDLSDSTQRTVGQLRKEVETASAQVEGIFGAWKERRSAADGELRAVKEELEDEDLYETYRDLRASVDDLKGLQPKVDKARAALERASGERAAAIIEHERLAAEEVRDFEKAAARVSGQLGGSVMVTTVSRVDHDAVKELLRRGGGRLAETLELFAQDDGFSPRDLAERIRKGMKSLVQRWTLSEAQAERLVATDQASLLELEELEPIILTNLQLNVATRGHVPRWQALADLSKGQKATAILLLLLLDSQAPLVVDQPEDDLDNRFIADRIVPAVRENKTSRQFLFSTHNANVPVLADAELIVGLVAEGSSDSRARATVPPDQRGSIDAPAIKHLIEERLEGGRAAFVERKRKYGL